MVHQLIADVTHAPVIPEGFCLSGIHQFLSMNTFRRLSFFFIAAALTAVSIGFLQRSYTYPFPSAALSPLPDHTMTDLSTVMAGIRRAGADIAWIQLLQYYGAPEKPLDRDTTFRLEWDMTKYLFGMGVEKEVCKKDGCTSEGHYHSHTEGGVYPKLYSYARRVVNLDPFFQYAYLFSAGALAWNLNRPEEAQSLLRRGIETMEKYRPSITRDPSQPYWQLHLYLSAIIYRNEGRHDEMTALLATAAEQPGAPNLVKSVLASLYQKQGNFPAALKLWLAIHDSGDPMYRLRSEEKIGELQKALGIAG